MDAVGGTVLVALGSQHVFVGCSLDLEDRVYLLLVVEHRVPPFERDYLEAVILFLFFDLAVSRF